jgi:hypothetical protein
MQSIRGPYIAGAWGKLPPHPVGGPVLKCQNEKENYSFLVRGPYFTSTLRLSANVKRKSGSALWLLSGVWGNEQIMAVMSDPRQLASLCVTHRLYRNTNKISLSWHRLCSADLSLKQTTRPQKICFLVKLLASVWVWQLHHCTGWLHSTRVWNKDVTTAVLSHCAELIIKCTILK